MRSVSALVTLVTLVALGALGALAGCHTLGADAPRAAPHPAFTRVQAGQDLDGAPAAKYFAAGEPTIFVVFASWCGHCRKELAVLAELRAGEPRVHVIGINAYEEWEQASDEATLRAYVAESAPWLPVVRADKALLKSLGGVPKIPSVFVFDGAGRLVERFKRNERPVPTLDELRATIAKLLPAARS